MTDCFWCGEEFNAAEMERCPNCSSDTDTKAIRIIGEPAQASGENETTSEV